MVHKIAFIGAGSMAEAIISGIIRRKIIDCGKIFVTNKSDEHRLKELSDQYHVTCTNDKEKALNNAEVVILSMKPQDVKEAIHSIKAFVTSDQLIISVVAGGSTDMILQLLQKRIPIIRAMPNTSAFIGYSATALSYGKYATEDHMMIAKRLFNTIGISTIIDEQHMHVVTSISGSGPAYFYYLVEAMEKAAIDLGFDPQVAQTLLLQTVVGGGEMLSHSGKSAKQLRQDITSPQGTTEAGLEALFENDFQSIVEQCIRAAHRRSIELGHKLSNE